MRQQRLLRESVSEMAYAGDVPTLPAFVLTFGAESMPANRSGLIAVVLPLKICARLNQATFCVG
jgi:hypothetical protein